MVRVGDFWIDRHESTLCPGDGSVGTDPGNDTTAAACSTAGVEPIVSVTWFQAAQLCANAGKHLCTNAQWQKAAAGTPDPRAWPGSVCSVPPESGLCNTCSATPRPTGQAAQCTSRWGAEDMIGNTWEWVADWHVGGTRWQTAPGQAATPWPAAQGYGDDADATFNVNGKPNTSVAATNGAPSAPLRSGANADGTTGGSFAFNASVAPSFRGASVGGRCCLGTASQ
jgi:formylglycine-generating enzyme required for sulfatase activity